MVSDVVQTLRDSIRGWGDPAFRHERAIARARNSLRRRFIAAAALSAATAILLPYSGISWLDVLWGAAAAGTVAAAVLAARELRRLERLPPPPRTPRRASAARAAVDRLERAGAALPPLLGHLGGVAGETASEAAVADRSLRELAASIDSIEVALQVSPAEAHAGLAEARIVLLTRLDEGTAAYERLVAAAAECVAVAAGGPDLGARHRLQEATDRLHGLASGLDEAQSAGRAILP
ncbi:MAG: hypothetical protein WCB04_11590 [Mycobacteriales bacterium]